MNPPIFFKTTDPDLVARHLRNRKSGKTYWRIYRKRNDGTNFVDPVEDREESEVGRCELCGIVILSGSERFCCLPHAEEHLRMANLDFEEKMWNLGVPVAHLE